MDNKATVLSVLKARRGQQIHISEIINSTGLSRDEVQKALLLLRPNVAAGQKRDCYYAK
ncbi:MAG: hypothetical protein LBC71_05010 [Oscillospiraceae bacterium]|nr:hypothetical protein [Oscillospiraceae bacterium]